MHAKTVLLIDHRESKIVKLHAFLENRVRAYDNLRLTACDFLC
jgi:hypothetical protein